MAKLLIFAGVMLVAIGLVVLAGQRFGRGRLPGDIVIERENFTLYLPITTSILVSLVLTLIFWLFSR
jgi:Na+-driven multidrug efflux pump